MLLHQLFEQDQADAASLIKQHCQPFLKLRVRLYRGMNLSSSWIKKISSGSDIELYCGAVRNDRTPKDMDPKISQVLDDYFKERVGVPLRSASLFCTKELTATARYGSPCLIFPIGEVHYCWSPYIRDAYATFQQTDWVKLPAEMRLPFEKFIEQTYREELTYDEIIAGKAKIAKEILAQFGDQLYQFDHGIKKSEKREIMVVCDKFYAVPLLDARSELNDGVTGFLDRVYD